MSQQFKFSALIRSGIIVAALVLIGRLSGFAREWFLAKTGASETTDLAIVLLTFPDLMVNLLLSGGLIAALVPAFKRLGPGGDTKLLLDVSRLIGGGFVLIACAVAIFAVQTLQFLAPGISIETLVSHADLFRWITGALPLAALSGVVVALLNTHGRFTIGAAGTLIFNLTVIGCLIVAEPTQIVAAITVGAILGAGIRLAAQVIALRRDWTPPATNKYLIDRTLVRSFLSSFGFITILSLLPPLARAISSLDDAGALSLFNFANKLVELPVGIIMGGIITVLLPRLATTFDNEEHSVAQANLSAGIRATLYITTGIAIPAAVFSDTLVSIAYFAAPFSAEQRNTLATMVTLGFASLPCLALLNFYNTAFTAAGRTRPLITAAIVMIFTIIVAAPISRAELGLSGVMATYGGSYLLGTIVLTRSVIIVFGLSTVCAALKDFVLTYLVPTLIALAIAIAGNILCEELHTRFLCAVASFVAYFSVLVWLDTDLRSRLANP